MKQKSEWKNKPTFWLGESLRIMAILCLTWTQGQKFSAQEHGESKIHLKLVLKPKFVEFLGTDLMLYSCT